jgi:hypothetical protein
MLGRAGWAKIRSRTAQQIYILQNLVSKGNNFGPVAYSRTAAYMMAIYDYDYGFLWFLL